MQQDISRVDWDIEQGHFAQQPVIQNTLAAAKQGGALHVFGLLSDGGVHSHELHIHALIRAAQDADVPNIFVHAFLDGRDSRRLVAPTPILSGLMPYWLNAQMHA